MVQKIYHTLKVRLQRFLYKLGYKNCIQGISLAYRLRYLTICGENNYIVINAKDIKKVNIVIAGNNHHLNIGENVIFKSGLCWFEDNNCSIDIKSNTTIESAELSVAEDNSILRIGSDCMISSKIRISTTDSHSVLDVTSGQRLNPAADVLIDDHVWIGTNVMINKGVHIESNSIVAGHSVVTKNVPHNTVVAGVPAKVVKNNIDWNRDRL